MATIKKTIFQAVPYNPEKHAPRNPKEEMSDLFFFLFTVFMAEKIGMPLTYGQLGKILFRAKELMAKRSIDFFFADFYIYKLGPYSNEHMEAGYLGELGDSGVITKDGTTIGLSASAYPEVEKMAQKYSKSDPDSSDVVQSITQAIIETPSFNKGIRDSHKVWIFNPKTKKIVTIDDLAKQFKEERMYIEYIESQVDIKKQAVVSDLIANWVFDLVSGADKNAKGALFQT